MGGNRSALLISTMIAASMTNQIAAAQLLRYARALSTGLRHSPLQTNVLSGGVIFCAGDAIAQQLEGGDSGGDIGFKEDSASSTSSKSGLDRNRLYSSCGLGATWSGVVVPFVYARAEAFFPGRTPRRVILKTACSASVLSIPGNWASMFLRRALAGDAPSAAAAASSAAWREVVTTDLRLWPVYDVLCFSVIPPHMRALTTALFSCAWSTYLSVVAHRPPPPEAAYSLEAADAPMPLAVAA